jgi:tRNA 2-thiouridine synthesizing protein C
VLQLQAAQQPDAILSRHYAATFGVLALYDIEHCYLCRDSLTARGLAVEATRVMDVEILDAAALRQKLASYDRILTL